MGVGWDLNPITSVLRRKKDAQKTHTQGSSPCDDRDRGWDVAAASQGHQDCWPPPGIARKRQGRSFPRAFRESVALLTSWFQDCSLRIFEKIHFYCCKPPRFWWWLTAALENEYIRIYLSGSFNAHILCSHKSRS